MLLPTALGAHRLTSKAENTAELDLVADRAHTYCVWQEVKMGILFARTKLSQVDEATGQAGVKKCKRAKVIEPSAAPSAAPPPAAVPAS